MKLVLSNNQSEKFVSYHAELQSEKKVYEYFGYNSLLFIFKKGFVDFITLNNGLHASDYEAAYLTSYISNVELAVAAAIVLDARGVRYVDSQLRGSISMTKLSECAQLAVSDISIPDTYAGAAEALLVGVQNGSVPASFPLILKRADADRGIDNYKINSLERLIEVLQSAHRRSLWVLQEFIPNEGFYRLSFYGDTLSTVIYRQQHIREDGDEEKQHLNKPKGGVNASLVEPRDTSGVLIDESRRACKVMRREFAGVDALIDSRTGTPYILEVNYNPQIVTVNAFRELRSKSFLDAMETL